jgi:hypothetical protein
VNVWVDQGGSLDRRPRATRRRRMRAVRLAPVGFAVSALTLSIRLLALANYGEKALALTESLAERRALIDAVRSLACSDS